MLSQIIIASLIGSVVALIGGVVLLWKEQWAKKVSLGLVSFASGSLLGAAFFELLPEAAKTVTVRDVGGMAVGGIIVFLLLEKFLNWYHCHNQQKCDYHTFSSTVLLGDALHNFLDGVAIALSFAVNLPLGIATTIAVFFHEVPQEIGDFGVLMHAGYKKSKVFALNFFTALATPLGAIMGYLLMPYFLPFMGYLLAFTAGVFLYISVSDLIPEVRHAAKPTEFGHIFMIIIGVLVIFAVGIILPE